MKKNERGERTLTAEGEIMDCVVQVLREFTRRGTNYYFRIIQNDKIIHEGEQTYDTTESAFTAAIQYLIPDSEVIEVPEISDEDFYALNTMLAMHTGHGPIEDIAQAVDWHNELVGGLAKLEDLLGGVTKDLEMIEDIVASAHHGGTEAMSAIARLQNIFEKDVQFLKELSARDIEILSAFIVNFTQK